MVLPSCAERVEVDGEHVRAGNTLQFDHSFDGPWTTTTLILERDGEQQTVSVPNTRPDGGRLVVGTVMLSAGYDVAVRGATLADEGPFYGTVLGGTAVVVGGLLAATGWQAQPVSFEGFCGPAD